MQRVVVIGLGIFGINIVRELFESGMEVIAIDKNKDAVQRIRDYATKAIVADGTDKELMNLIGIHESDIVIISFGEDLAASTLITLNLKQLKIKRIIVKAPNDEYKTILEKVGATDVIIPEKEMAHRIAKNLIRPNVLDYLPVSDDFSVFEMAPPISFLGKSLAVLQLRNRFNIHVIAIRDVISDKVIMVPGPEYIIKDGEVLVIVGREKDISGLE
jgi:trk system potassium uptake protein